MKIYKKSECTYKDGFILKKNKTVRISVGIVSKLNRIEQDLQRAVHAEENKVEPIKEPEPFVPRSEHSCKVKVTAASPELDKIAERTKEIMDELDVVGRIDRTQAYLDNIEDVLLWVSNDEFFGSSKDDLLIRFDLPLLGNPLELTVEKLLDAAEVING